MRIKCKFYMAEFLHKDTNRRLIKFGITKHMDALKRFSMKESISFGRSPNQYEDFKIRILFSIPCESFYEAKTIEDEMLDTWYPKGTFKVEKSLGLSSLDKYSNMSGVTELRYLTAANKRDVIRYLKEMYYTQEMKQQKQRRKRYYNAKKK